ncbi:MAG: phosphopantetheine-binding protein [Lachnospiraceae bacterium]|jgi:acyl carrier protein|nr:phosphopantetheine-binding protein [Lachnospiraceae bacterium]
MCKVSEEHDLRVDTRTQILQILRDMTKQEISLDMKLLETGLLDSMNIIALLLEAEDRFSICFAQDLELDFLEDVSSLTDHIVSKRMCQELGRETAF